MEGTAMTTPTAVVTTTGPGSGTTRSALPADRLVIQDPASLDSPVDGAWWPESSNLAEEVPKLLRRLWADGAKYSRVAYRLGAWGPAPRKVVVAGTLVHLGGFAHHDPHVLSLVATSGHRRLDLLVIEPDTSPAVARRALQLAAVPHGTLGPSEILGLAAEGGHGDESGVGARERVRPVG